MKRDLRLLVQFNHKSGPDAVLETLQSRLPGAKRERESLVYRNNVLSFGKGVLAGHRGEFDYEISVFPLDQDPAFEIQRGLLKEVRTATQCSARRTRSRFLWTIRSWLKPLKEQAAEATFAVVEHPLESKAASWSSSAAEPASSLALRGECPLRTAEADTADIQNLGVGSCL